MNICMVVCNNLTRDSRVLREARTLQRAGHAVTIVGTPESAADLAFERGGDGEILHRVSWLPRAWRWLGLRLALWTPIILAVLALLGWLAFESAEFIAAGMTATAILTIAVAIAAAAIALGIGLRTARTRQKERDRILRNTESLSEARSPLLSPYPAPRSLLPAWLPVSWLDAASVPMALLGRRFRHFALSQMRARILGDFIVTLKPDVLHAHDCTSLPIAARVKRSLDIPVIYDAHEIYDDAAARRFGVTDYFVALHRNYLPLVSRFITVNKSIALYYRYAYPKLSPAVVIRNAAVWSGHPAYDGRLHAAAGLPRSEKILLYQGGFTAARGLPVLVQAASLLPDGWTLVMMGWGPLEAGLRKLASRVAKPGKVRFIPAAPRDDLAQWSAGASAGMIPYENTVLNHWFCTPNKVWEYAGAGVPMIVQPFPELRLFVEQFGCGWLLPDLTPEAIAGLVANLSEADLKHARDGCARLMQADNWDTAYAGPLIGLYRDLAEPAPKPAAALCA